MDNRQKAVKAMTLFLDGDAFPNQLKSILFRAVERFGLRTIAVSNKPINIGRSENITYIIVGTAPDEADNRIMEMAGEGDLIITNDILLADRAIDRRAHVINYRGSFYNTANIKERLAIRNLLQDIRDSGLPAGGPAPFSQKDAHEFANQLNKFLTKQT